MFIAAENFAQVKIEYPKTKKVEQTDDYHGTKVSDPFRWLEDDNSAETKAWVEAQNKVTFDYLKTIPEREQLKKRLTELWDYEKYSAPFKEGGKYFYYKNDGLQNQSVLYVTDSPEKAGRVLLDPNKLSTDGTVALVRRFDFRRRQNDGLRRFGVGFGLAGMAFPRCRERQGFDGRFKRHQILRRVVVKGQRRNLLFALSGG